MPPTATVSSSKSTAGRDPTTESPASESTLAGGWRRASGALRRPRASSRHSVGTTTSATQTTHPTTRERSTWRSASRSLTGLSRTTCLRRLAQTRLRACCASGITSPVPTSKVGVASTKRVTIRKPSTVCTTPKTPRWAAPTPRRTSLASVIPGRRRRASLSSSTLIRRTSAAPLRTAPTRLRSSGARAPARAATDAYSISTSRAGAATSRRSSPPSRTTSRPSNLRLARGTASISSGQVRTRILRTTKATDAG
mmetsp:Transcript_25024/g.78935  ORF Transcript_25024/g.78935 Transcript_25024/m.78935 type:complete len:254 (-) Transcript_25024:1329-2090(-)